MAEQVTEVEATVKTLMDIAGLAPSPEEMAILVDAYPLFKEGVESLYAIPAVRYEAPGLIFNPAPVFADWSK